MTGHSRRNFLKNTALASTAAALSPLTAHGADPVAKGEMAIARWTGAPAEDTADLGRKLTEKVIADLGGMDRFVKRGDVVWVKPNIAWTRTPEQAANTNPDVVATLVRLCKDAGARTVKVGDHPCHAARQSYPTSGIAAAAEAAGAEVVYLDTNRFRDMDIGGQALRSHPVYPEIIESDLVINVPVAKHHAATTLTMCMKNYMGVADKRGIFHQDLATAITDMAAFMKPRLCVLDAIRVLVANGPTGGSLDDVEWKGALAAGTDIVALDAWGAELMGYDPESIETVTLGQARGLGTLDYRSLGPKESELS